jgi:hypothetical protein
VRGRNDSGAVQCAVGCGTATITATSGSLTATVEVPVFVAIQLWSGAADSLWSNAENWLNGVVPDSSAKLVFNSGQSNMSMTNDLETGIEFESMTFFSAYSLGGNEILLRGGVVLWLASLDHSWLEQELFG